MRIFITGATGFLGNATVNYLHQLGHDVTAATRRSTEALPLGVGQVQIPSIDDLTAWEDVLEGVDVVVHCAARVHIMQDHAANPLDAFRCINTEGTLRLARAAIAANVKRLIFISTIGIHGSETHDAPFYADSPAYPDTPYAQSKWEAEQGLLKLGSEGKLEITIIRSPLIYGKDAPGNFSSLLRAVNKYIPLPLGGIKNKRSFAAVENVADLIARCTTHAAAANQAFLVSDGEILSSAEFIRKIAHVQGKASMLIPAPQFMLELLTKIAGKEKQLRKLTCSLHVDISKNAELLGWHPLLTTDAALHKSLVPDPGPK